MKIYVDKNPENCIDCPFSVLDGTYFCSLTGNECKEYRDLCPLKCIKDHDRAIKQHAYKKGYNDMRIQYELGKNDKE